jgi:hypothetical protein
MGSLVELVSLTFECFIDTQALKIIHQLLCLEHAEAVASCCAQSRTQTMMMMQNWVELD